jgi:hypothetical protein
MRKFLTICAILLSLSASAQWQLTGSRVRYVNGIGIPTRDTSAMTPADSSQILIRPADSALYVRYKRAWQKVGAGGGGISGSGTINRVPKWTSSTAIGNSSIVDSASAVAMTISPLGRIGIGKSNPSGVLDVKESEIDITSYAYGLDFKVTGAGGFSRANRFYNTSALSSNAFFGVLGDASAGVTRSYWLIGNPATDTTGYTNTNGLHLLSSGNIGIGYTTPAAKLSVNGTALINTNTDNGVDALQVSGSAVASVLKATGTGNNLGILNGTGTTNAYIDFQNAGTTQWRAGNDYNGGSRLFRINDVAGNVNTMLVNSSNQIGFNMPTTSFLGSNSAFEFHKRSSQFIGRYFAYDANGLGVSIDTRSTRTNTYGAFSATLSGDPIFQFYTNGSDNSAHRIAGFFGYIQEGTTTTTAVPGFWSIESSSGSQQGRTKIRIDGNNDYLGFYTSSSGFNNFSNERMRVASSGALLINTTTDNNVDELQVNGSISGIGFKQAYVTKTGAYTATNDDYVIDCTSGTFTVTLPASSGRTGRILIIKNSGAGTITVDGNASETIDGATTYSLSVQYATVQIMSDGTNWKIISKF